MLLLKFQYKDQSPQELNVSNKTKVTIGRSKDSDIHLDSDYGISRQHIEISKNESDEWTIRCISTIGGLSLNGKMINEAPLKDGDSFSLVGYQFQWIQKEEGKTKKDSQKSSSKNKKEDKKLDNTSSVGHWLEQSASQSQIFTTSHKAVKLDPFTQKSETVVADISSMISTYLVISLSEDDPEESIHLKEGSKWIIGRDRDCEICIEDKSVSRQHFEITKEGDEYFIKDLGSSNSTLLEETALEPHKKISLHSGSMIRIKNVQMFFEIRNLKMQKESESLPQVSDSIPSENKPSDSLDSEKLENINMPNVIPNETMITSIPPSNPKSTKKKWWILILASVLAVGALGVIFNLEQNKPEDEQLSNTEEQDNPKFKSLSIAQQDQVKDLYDHAKKFYSLKKYQLCVNKIQTLHSIVPFYAQSKQVLGQCQTGIEHAVTQLEMERKAKEQEANVQLVNNNVKGCKKKFKTFSSLESLKYCLSPSLERDPAHSEIQKLISKFEMQQQEKELKKEQKKILQQSIAKEKRMYNRAKKLKEQKKFFRSIDAYEAFLKRDHPSHRSIKVIVKKAQSELKSLKNQVAFQLNNSLTHCKNNARLKRFKVAYPFCKEALALSPKNPQPVQEILDYIIAELEKELKSLYENSVINESLGNVDAAISYWKKIIQKDIPEGEYYKKAQQKLSKY